MPKFKPGQDVFIKIQSFDRDQDGVCPPNIYTIGRIIGESSVTKDYFWVTCLVTGGDSVDAEDMKPYHEDWVGKSWEDL